MISKEEAIPICRQCELLNITRSGFYYKPKERSNFDLKIMRLIDEIYLINPTMGSRRMSKEITKTHKLPVGRLRVRRLMREMCINAIYPKKNLSLKQKGHKIYPYLLRNLNITRPNQVWSTDITYIRMESGFMYLTAVIDWYSRKVLSWQVSNTMEAAFCKSVVKEAIQKYGTPEIFNTDQGSQYTSDEFTGLLKDHQIKISMDGKGRALDNIFVERLWRTVKQEEVYLKDYSDIKEARKSLEIYFEYYNFKRRHQTLGDEYPADVYCKPDLNNVYYGIIKEEVAS